MDSTFENHTTTNDLPEHELDKTANLYRENKQKFLSFKERAEYLGGLLKLDPDASMLEYSPHNSYMATACLQKTDDYIQQNNYLSIFEVRRSAKKRMEPKIVSKIVLHP